MAPYAAHRIKKPKAKWSMTVMMNARDLSRDDDFLSHLLVEHLGTDENPLQVHKMDPSRRLPKHDPLEVLAIVKKYVVRKGGSSTSAHRVKRAVDALLELAPVKQYLHKRSAAQINAFATHASRYFELYLPTGSIEISHTSRYSHRTGKSELCILATTPLKVGQVISDLKGSLAHLTTEEDEELKRTDSRRGDGGIRRDFSVIHSNQKNKSHLFLGPARFVNHDCDHNVELFRDGRIITFRVIKPIAAGQEVTAHYGEGYFGKGNRHCLCQTCERLGRGGYTTVEIDSEHEVGDDSSTDEETREERIKAGLGLNAKGNPNERRTRRGVYAILPEEDTDNEDRVGATEKVATEVPQQPTDDQSKIFDVNAPSSASAGVDPSSSSNSPSNSPITIPPLSSEGAHVKQHERHVSSASSMLSSLPDIDKSEPSIIGPTSSVSDFSSSPLSIISDVGPVGGTPSNRMAETVKALATPAMTRRSTRSSTLSQQNKLSKEEISSDVAEQAISVPLPDKRGLRGLRGSRSTAALEIVAPEAPKPSEHHVQDLTVRPKRKTRHSVPSTSDFLKGPEGGSSTTPGLSSNATTKTTQMKPFIPTTPSASGSTIVSSVVGGSKIRNVPRCGTCSTELPYLTRVKSVKKAPTQCVRCKRHFAIFGALWPNRNPADTLSSSSSESSSTETVHEIAIGKSKDFSRFGPKFKYSRKYVEIKHPAVERPVKRRKTDPAGYPMKSSLYTTYRNTHPHYISKNKLAKRGFLSKNNLGIPGEAILHPPSKSHLEIAATLGRKRSRESTENSELRALDRIRSKRRGWEGGEQISTETNHILVSGSRRTIRRFPSLPSLPGTKPLAALCARPSPNSFARYSWAAFEQVDIDITAASSMDTGVDSKGALGQEMKVSSDNDQKRKRESSDLKPKGKTFYMKDEKKPMPKGWVLVTDSSEETGEEEVEEETNPAKDKGSKGISSCGVTADLRTEPFVGKDKTLKVGDAQIFYQDAGTDSPPSSTPSLAHTPSSRATSTPTQSSGTLVDEHVGALPSTGKRVVSKYALRGSNAALVSPNTQSSKRRRIGGYGSIPHSKLNKAVDVNVGANVKTSADGETGGSNDTIHIGRPEALAIPELDVESEDNEFNLEDAKTHSNTITMIHASFSPSPETAIKGKQISVPVAESGNPTAIFFGDYKNHDSGIEVPDSDTKRAALEISNIIHNTAFTYGLPDARTSWKPNYHFSELDGWDSDPSGF